MRTGILTVRAPRARCRGGCSSAAAALTAGSCTPSSPRSAASDWGNSAALPLAPASAAAAFAVVVVATDADADAQVGKSGRQAGGAWDNRASRAARSLRAVDLRSASLWPSPEPPRSEWTASSIAAAGGEKAAVPRPSAAVHANACISRLVSAPRWPLVNRMIKRSALNSLTHLRGARERRTPAARPRREERGGGARGGRRSRRRRWLPRMWMLAACRSGKPACAGARRPWGLWEGGRAEGRK